MQSRMPDDYSTKEQVEALLAEAKEAASMQPGGRSPARRRKNRTKRQKVLHTLANVAYGIVITVLLLCLYIGVQSKMNDQPASILGYSIYMVKTGSMVPTLPIGSYIVSRAPEDASALTVGTVTTFRRTDGSIVTHRIIEVLSDGDGVRYRTKGDNPQNDPDLELVTPDRVLGTLQFSVSLPKIWQEQ